MTENPLVWYVKPIKRFISYLVYTSTNEKNIISRDNAKVEDLRYSEICCCCMYERPFNSKCMDGGKWKTHNEERDV